MAKKSTISLFWLILNIAVGALLAIGGIWALQGGGDFGCKAIKSIFSGDFAKIMGIVFGIIELLSGIFIILQLFIGDRVGRLGTILKLIIIIVWAIAIVLADFIHGNFNNFLSWFYDFAMHVIILCALLVTRD